MINYSEYFKKIEGELLIIAVSAPITPLKGMAGLVDWVTNAVISKAIVQKKYSGREGEALLLNTKDALPVERTVILGAGASGKNLKSDVEKILKGLKIKYFSLVTPKNMKVDFRGVDYNVGNEKILVIAK